MITMLLLSIHRSSVEPLFNVTALNQKIDCTYTYLEHQPTAI